MLNPSILKQLMHHFQTYDSNNESLKNDHDISIYQIPKPWIQQIYIDGGQDISIYQSPKIQQIYKDGHEISIYPKNGHEITINLVFFAKYIRILLFKTYCIN